MIQPTRPPSATVGLLAKPPESFQGGQADGLQFISRQTNNRNKQSDVQLKPITNNPHNFIKRAKPDQQ